MKHKSLVISYLNIRSLRNKLIDIETYIKKENIDILTLTETWLYPNESPFIFIQGYSAIHECRKIGRGGGVSIFLKEELNFNILESESVENCEFIIIEITSVQPKPKIGIFYRPPKVDISKFFQIINDITGIYNNLILLGDMNLNLLENNDLLGEYQSIYVTNGYKILNVIDEHHYTRKNHNNKKTILDHFVSNYQLNNIKYHLEYDDYHLSDHKLIKIKTENLKKNKAKMIEKTIAFIDVKKFRDLISKENDSLNNIPTFEELANCIKKAKEKSTKRKKVKIRENNDWITTQLIDKMKIRDNLYKKHKKHPNNIHIESEFKKIKNEINTYCKKLKRESLNRQFEKAGTNPKKLWNVINKNIGNKNKNNSITQIKNRNGNLIKSKKEICNEFIQFFSDIGLSSSKKFKPQLKNITPFKKSMFLKPVSEDEICNIIMLLKSNTSPGEDEITSTNLKDISDLISLPLSLIINKCIEDGIFPDYLKRTVLKPIFKGGESENISNYRPIALLNVFAKIFEKVLKTQIINFINDNNGFNNFQYAFQPNSNTQSAVTDLMNYIYESLDMSNYGVAIFLDIKKAFDTVNHQILLDILEKVGVRGHVHNLFKNYFENRIQYVKIENYKSAERKCETGVPQGSVLAPILYLIYVNSIVEISLNSKHLSFADDTVLFFSSKEKNILEKNIREDIKKIEDWLNRINLTININKTVYIIFKQKNMKKIQLNIEINNKPINEVKEHKYLGIIVDTNLNFESHVNKIKKNIIPLIGAIRRMNYSLNDTIQNLIYNAHILSRIRYLITIWSSCNQKEKGKIYRLMNKAIKVIYRKPWDTPSQELYKTTKNITLDQLIKFEKSKFAYKLLKNKQKTNITIKKKCRLHDHNVRNANDFYLKNVHSNKGKTNPISSCLETFNKMPEQIRNSKSINQFSIKMKQFFLM